MKKLKVVLHCKYFYIALIIFSVFYSAICLTVFKPKSKINCNQNKIIGIITNIKTSGSLLSLEIKGFEKIIGSYYFKTEEEKNNFILEYELGDTVYLEGSLARPTNNTVPNLFNYKLYLERKNIFYVMNISKFEKINDNSNYFYSIKNTIIKHIDHYENRDYLHTFILGNNDFIVSDIQNAYQEIGVSHLLAISSMHVSLLSSMILFLLRRLKLNEKISYLVTVFFLLFFMLLSGNTASVSRSVILYALLTLNKFLKLDIRTIDIFKIVFCILIVINPNILFDVGFEFSFIVSFYLMLLQDKLKGDNYIKSLFKTSIISFLVSIPISIYYFYQINILSVVFNLIFVPLVSLVIFPFSIMTFFFSMLEPILSLLIDVMESLSSMCNQIAFGKLIFAKPSVMWIVFYYGAITLFLYKGRKIGLVFMIILLLIHYFSLIIFPSNFLVFIDVGQGDSILINSASETLLIDTGGKVMFKQDEWKKRKIKSITDTTTIPLLKSLGIKRIDSLILTHGDYDHMGEAINLVENFKIEKVIFNCGEFNELEQDLIKVLDKKKIPYYSCVKELNIDNNKLYFLNNTEYGNENDNSNVIYTELNGYKFMFMGDASITTEKEIMSIYNLPNIDVLKVGHHGSKTSSSEEFIDEIKPKYSIISVGKNNRYGHPNKEVLENLENTKIYRTDQDGSIIFKIKNNKLQIETCPA